MHDCVCASQISTEAAWPERERKVCIESLKRFSWHRTLRLSVKLALGALLWGVRSLKFLEIASQPGFPRIVGVKSGVRLKIFREIQGWQEYEVQIISPKIRHCEPWLLKFRFDGSGSPTSWEDLKAHLLVQ